LKNAVKQNNLKEVEEIANTLQIHHPQLTEFMDKHEENFNNFFKPDNNALLTLIGPESTTVLPVPNPQVMPQNPVAQVGTVTQNIGQQIPANSNTNSNLAQSGAVMTGQTPVAAQKVLEQNPNTPPGNVGSKELT
jgi:hypothetical protein